ncbi:hypothetical protein MO973_07800 [Paenibacillus sp. TRM 82003]|nr:hypothetical protein [Paenibacillus sp. TRM 82003]
MDFEHAYRRWRREQAERGKPIARRSTESGGATYRFARDVWFPLFGSLEGWFADYETLDEEGVSRTLQYALLRPGLRLNVELEERKASSSGEVVHRDFALELAGWDVLRLSMEALVADPAACRAGLASWFDRRLGAGRAMSCAERRLEDVVKLARQGRALVSARDVANHLQVSDKTARTILRELLQRGAFAAASEGKRRIHRYRLVIPRR